MATEKLDVILNLVTAENGSASSVCGSTERTRGPCPLQKMGPVDPHTCLTDV